MAGKPILYLVLILVIIVAFLVILSFVMPNPAVAPAERLNFIGPPPGEPAGFKGPTSSPPF